MIEHFEFTLSGSEDKILAWGFKGGKTLSYRWRFKDGNDTWWDQVIETVSRNGMTIKDWVTREFYVDGCTRKA